MNKNQSKTIKGAFLPEIQNLLHENFLPVVSWWPHCFHCFSNVGHRGKEVCHCGSWFATMTKKIFTFHSCSRVRVKQCAWNLHQSGLTSKSIDFFKKPAKSIIKTGVTIPDVQKCVMVATFILYWETLLFWCVS